MRREERTRIASEALRAAIKLASETVEIVDMSTKGFPVSALNSTATIATMEKRIAAMQRFVDMLREGAA